MPSFASHVPAHQANLPRARRVGALLLATLCISPALAQHRQQDGQPASIWSLGVGAVSMQKPYRGMDREYKALPVFQFENRYLHLSGPQIGLKLPGIDIGTSQPLAPSLVVRYDDSGYKAKDAPVLSGMQRRKGGVWVGAELAWKTDLANLKAAWLADASGNSKGKAFSLGLDRTWRLGEHVMLTPRLQATWHDAAYVDYYFGVRHGEARPGRAAYQGKSGISTEAGLRAVYRFDRHHALFMDIAVSTLPKAIKDSPLVNRSSESRMMLGYIYRFQ